ncbi:hypothetical protein BRX36_19870 [Sphingomonas sp. S-NIH.Pt1_0416]|uniref:hypothetical protein n=1 Tax=Sphingomonas sp. S-NIH.Pt1_0416 TaxID=1920123 RepID=UPI000F7D7B4E|nr:hypothetical protein [Sphingomonas sp. S-NIH.Pt1_0416]RSU58925.1 hypothetical protein BRX36_19870 [Sphingomonas sp. S-NIH.Pt1_0416]
MSAAKLRQKDGLKVTGARDRKVHTARGTELRVAAAAAAGKVDVQALFDSTMNRFPKTMARLAE